MLPPDGEELSRFIGALFKRAAPDGYVLLRGFYGDSVRLWRQDLWRSVKISDDLKGEAGRLMEAAARTGENVVFCPPVATFLNGESAEATNLKEGLVILVDCDDKCSPSVALEKLEAVLGPATLVVASGGTVNGEDKLHLYWRLAVPSRSPQDHALLKVCRSLAARYVGADTTSGPPNHPIRWAGSWHLKGEPRLARIVKETDEEVDLASALALLRGAIGEQEDDERHSGIGEADPVDVAAALNVIPNPEMDWDGWNRVGMAVWRATSGSDEGLAAWISWSAKSSKNKPTETLARWRHYRASPPTAIGAGSLFYMARECDPNWRRPTEIVPAFSEEGLALRMAEKYAEELRYTEAWKRWHHWTGTYWREDRTLVSLHLTREICRQASQEVNKVGVANRLASAKTVSSVVGLVKSDRKVAAVIEQWDANPWLLGTPGGTVDLQRGTLIANGIDNYITRITPYTPEGDCPIWKNMLREIFKQDEEIVSYAQRICGYCLTGVTREELMFFFHGEGGNGKGTFIETFVAALGGYATTVAMNTLIMTKHTEHQTEIAKLYGMRLAVASETNDIARWNSAKIKLLTGGDQLTGRFMRGDFFNFSPSHKLVISSNKKPMLGRVDNAIARRTILLPFLVLFTSPDKRLKEKLRSELGGILLWAIEGCLIWQRWGMVPPKSVLKATEEYLHDQDDIQMFIEECCEVVEVPKVGKGILTSSTILYGAWQRWCERNGGYAGPRKDFSQRMMSKFAYKSVNNLIHFRNVRLLEPEPPADFGARIGELPY